MRRPGITTRRAVLAGGAAVALTGAAIGGAAAQAAVQPPPGAEKFQIKLDEKQIKEQQDKYFDTLAGKLGVGRDKLESAMNETSKELAAAMGVPFFPMFGPPPLPSQAKGEAGGVMFFGTAPKEKAEVDVIFKRAEKPAG